MATRTWSTATAKNFSDATAWDGGVAVPVTTDALVFSNAGVGNCTIDNLGTWSGGTFTVNSTYTGTISQNSGINITTAAYSQVGGTTTWNSGATFNCTTLSLTGGTFNQGGVLTASSTLTIGAGTFVGSSAAMSCVNMVSSNAGGNVTCTSGTWTIAGTITRTATWGTFNANGGTIALTGAGAQTLNMPYTLNLVTITKSGQRVTIPNGVTCPLGANPTVVETFTLVVQTGATVTASGVITMTGGGGLSLQGTGIVSGAITDMNITDGAVSIVATTTFPVGVNIQFTVTGAAALTLGLGGKTYGTFRRTGSGSSQINLSDIALTNTFTTFQDNDGSVAHTLNFTAGSTWSAGTWLLGGASAKLLSIASATPGSPFTLNSSGGAVNVSYMSITDSTVDASPLWTANDGTSTNGGGNTNWIFSAVSSAVDVITFFRRTGRR